jgi:WD40 repeat protein
VLPSINIYEYPSLKLFRVLREGTLEAYAHLNFSSNGTKLASLGSSPDFMLTVWDWKNEKVILRSKAFSQDVYKVAFSPENEGHLCTSGSGHIRYEMSSACFLYALYSISFLNFFLISRFSARDCKNVCRLHQGITAFYATLPLSDH